MNRKGSLTILAFIGLIVVVGVLVSFGVPQPRDTGVESFESEQAFRDYIEQGGSVGGTAGFGGSFQGTAETDDLARQARETAETDAGGDGGGGTTAERFSSTNVQHEAIDEPDIVKTDGDTIYISRSAAERSNITLVDALPAEEATVVSSVRGTAGDWWRQADRLLLRNDTMIAIGQDALKGFDISDVDAPEQVWEHTTNGTVQTGRMYGGELYLVVREDVDREDPCPIRPLAEGVTVPCTSIYHPLTPSEVDVTYSFLRLSTGGEVEDATSFTGSSQDSVVYMSQNGIYLTYKEATSESSIVMDFFMSDGADLLDEVARERIQRLQGYELSDRATMVEVQDILQRYRERLDEDERLTLENELENRFGNWTRSNIRDYVRSGIVRVGLEEFEAEETGEVPGVPLNQFSMDEHDGHLRIATTVSSPVHWQVSTNDLYVLDEDLDVTGSVKDMGIDQRIYSVRFMGDEGYVVTFRQIDPFYVLDLSDPEEPSLEGELKLPGFSSYLHRLEEDRILGVGEEEGQVKAVIFDVSDPTEPTIEDEYRLSDRWSAISDSHHAFLQDERHEVFFLPASSGGYIFSYADGLELEKAVSVPNAQRALYVNDYMYVVSESQMVILDEEDWSRVRSVDLGQVQEELPRPEPRPMIR